MPAKYTLGITPFTLYHPAGILSLLFLTQRSPSGFVTL